MYRTQVGVLKQVHEERLGGLLQRQNPLALPAQFGAVGLELEGDFSDLYSAMRLANGERGCGSGRLEERRGAYEAGKGQLGHEQVGVGLVAADFFQREGAGAVAALSRSGDGVAGCGGGVRNERGKAIEKGDGGSYVARGLVLVASSLLVLPPPPPLLMAALGVGVRLLLRPRVFAWPFREASCGFGWRKWPAQKGIMLCDGIERGGKVREVVVGSLAEAPGSFATGR